MVDAAEEKFDILKWKYNLKKLKDIASYPKERSQNIYLKWTGSI